MSARRSGGGKTCGPVLTSYTLCINPFAYFLRNKKDLEQVEPCLGNIISKPAAVIGGKRCHACVARQ